MKNKIYTDMCCSTGAEKLSRASRNSLAPNRDNSFLGPMLMQIAALGLNGLTHARLLSFIICSQTRNLPQFYSMKTYEFWMKVVPCRCDLVLRCDL